MATNGGQILRNRSALDEKLTAELTTLQNGIKDLASSQVTNQSKQQQSSSMTMMMMMMRR